MTSRWWNRALELVVWWVALTVLELMLISAVDRAELVLAIALGLVGATVAVAARAAQPASWSLPRWSLRALLWVPGAVVRDSVAVFIAAIRGDTGSWRRFPVDAAAGDDAAARGARAVASLLISASPSTVVIGVDPDNGEALAHQLAGAQSAPLEKAVSP